LRSKQDIREAETLAEDLVNTMLRSRHSLELSFFLKSTWPALVLTLKTAKPPESLSDTMRSKTASFVLEGGSYRHGLNRKNLP